MIPHYLRWTAQMMMEVMECFGLTLTWEANQSHFSQLMRF